MIIGTFLKNNDGGFHGQINAAGLHIEQVVFEQQAKGADYVLSGDHKSAVFEVGAAWKKTGDYGDYLSVRIDSPVLLAPINATMKLEPSTAGLYALRWQRRREDGKDEG